MLFVRIQLNTLTSCYISYPLLSSISNMFRFLLSHRQGGIYVYIHTQGNMYVGTDMIFVMFLCYSLLLAMYMDIVVIAKIEN